MIQLALDVGFWNRLMGLLSVPKAATIERIIALAFSYPTLVRISPEEAAWAMQVGRLAMTAAKRWGSGVNPEDTKAPTVNLPRVPSLEGDPERQWQAGLLTKTVSGPTEYMPTFIEVAAKTPFQSALDQVRRYLEKFGYKYPKFAKYLADTIENWENGGKNNTVPLWLVKGQF